jgi:hypothetical protein
MNKISLPQLLQPSQLFSALLCITSILFINTPTSTKANNWNEFNAILSSGIVTMHLIGMPSDGFNNDFSNYWNTLTSNDQHNENANKTQAAAQRASQIGWLAIYTLYNATVNNEYSYEDFQNIVIDFFNKVYTRVPSTYNTTQQVQAPNGKGGTTTVTRTVQQTDPNPRYMFGATLGTLPINNDCNVNIGFNSPINELGLAMRYQTLTIIYVAITKNFFSKGINGFEETTRILEGQEQETSTSTPQAQVFQNSILPYLEMVMQDPFCETNATFARGIICIAIKKGIIPEGSASVSCDEEPDLSNILGCTPPPLS